MGYSLVERPEARYKIVYGKHIEMTSCSELPLKPDALFLEGSERYSNFEVGYGYSYKDSGPYLKIIKRAQEEEVKIYLGDIYFKGPPFQVRIKEFNFSPDWPSVLKLTEACVGGVLAGSLAREIDQKKKITRRDLFKRIGKGAVAAWNLSFLSKLGYIFFKEGQEVPRVLEKVMSAEDPLHPEFLTLWLRNAVVVKKLITIGKREQIKHKRKAEIAVVFGGDHVGLAGFLRSGEKYCQKLVRRYPRWFLKAMITNGNLDYISLIIEAKFDPQYRLWVVTDRFHDEGLYFSVNREQEYLSARKEIR